MKLNRYVTMALAVAALIITACGENSQRTQTDSYYKNLYETQLNKTNASIEKHNQMLMQSYETDQIFVATAGLIGELDAQALICRAKVKAIRENLSTVSEETLRREMRSLENDVNKAVNIVTKLEKKLSKDGMDRLLKNVDSTIAEHDRTKAKERRRTYQRMLSHLAGMRDVFLGMYNDLRSDANARLASLGARPTTSRAAVNPVVSSSREGGRIVGIVRDSVSGSPLSGAFVGFKRLAESTDYFHTTRTDRNGQYQSPYLRQGNYYVDIRHDDYISTRAEEVRVIVGRQSQENVSVTKPLGEGVYRITMSWCGTKQGAVRDVDSYLQIPGASTPLSYRSKARIFNGAHLDRDDTDWVGPETITIKDLQQGTYIYYVNNYNFRQNLAALGNSDVRVRVFKGRREIKNYRVPAGKGITYELFRIVNGQLQSTQRFTNSLVIH